MITELRAALVVALAENTRLNRQAEGHFNAYWTLVESNQELKTKLKDLKRNYDALYAEWRKLKD